MDFIEELLVHLPVHLSKGESTTAVIERSPKILFDRLISYYVQKAMPSLWMPKSFKSSLKNDL